MIFPVIIKFKKSGSDKKSAQRKIYKKSTTKVFPQIMLKCYSLDNVEKSLTLAMSAVFTAVTMTTVTHIRSMCVVTKSFFCNVTVMLTKRALVHIYSKAKTRKSVFSKKRFEHFPIPVSSP